MNYKSIICLGILLCAWALGYGQEQQGYVKTRGRMVSGKHVEGKRVANATVQVKGRSALDTPTPTGRMTQEYTLMIM